ncbi:hypothetical protein [Mycolicibacterium gadium]|uniref:Uncharacterized protein n=1 Tax=Mycolicibacterium gadium TaxID=1794 RepID=A0ABT6GIV0_MYCGU|nr:hypothetical protein [Mycolicibacterium gadium]MDG5481312.1 hypothetical protein [Mycolicibacterium gadium]
MDFSYLSENWFKWTSLAGMSRVAISEECADCQIFFKSDDQSFHLRRNGHWWTVDAVDDRGKRYSATAGFSSFALAEVYLIWRWASVTRSAVGAKQLGREFHALGMSPSVEVLPTEREYFVELRASTGSAILPVSSATVFSHVMPKPLSEIEQLVHEGLH